MVTLLSRRQPRFSVMTDKIVILSTCATAEEAEKLARELVDARLAACVSLIPRMRSYFRWKGAVETADECLLVIKTSRSLFDSVRLVLEKSHTYEVPEMIALQIVEGSENYMNWMQANLESHPESN
jgi:periplasmic divalent cation tolerance protein